MKLDKTFCPLLRKICSKTGREYICTEYNKIEEGYRSPFAASEPEPANSKMEFRLSKAFDVYCRSYYTDALSSCYVLGDSTSSSFSVAVLVQANYVNREPLDSRSPEDRKEESEQASRIKTTSRIQSLGKRLSAKIFPTESNQEKETNGPIKEAIWQAVHLITISTDRAAGKSNYKTSSQIQILLEQEKEESSFCISMDLTDTNEKTVFEEKTPEHVVWIGRLIEDTENRLRARLKEVYLDQTRDVCKGEVRVPEL